MRSIRRLFSRTPRQSGLSRGDRALDDDKRAYLLTFIHDRRGVEAWVESPTRFNKPSLLLVAHDGEWVRRTVPSGAWAFDFCSRHEVPAYQAGVVPYPQRKRDWDARHR